MTEHTVKSFDDELNWLDVKIAEMGGIALEMLSASMEALTSGDVALAEQVSCDTRLDTLQRDIEKHAILAIARRQPVAVDLRQILSALRICLTLERVGDKAKNIASRAAMAGDVSTLPSALVGLKAMHEFASRQLTDVLDAYAKRDADRAKAIWERDVELDDGEEAVYRTLVTFMIENPRNMTSCMHLLFCTKNLERVGDYATNIAETVVFTVSGELLPTQRPHGGQGRRSTLAP